MQKAPAARIGDLAVALKEVFNSYSCVVTIGPRHGNNAFKTLLAREEAAKAVDMGLYHRVHPTIAISTTGSI